MKAKTETELLNWQPPVLDYIISNGILVPQTKLVLYGKWETWKSMLAMHLGYCIASGRPWFGFQTTQSSVYNYQIEIPEKQLQKRIRKYTTGNNIHCDNIYFRSELFVRLDQGGYMSELKAELNDSASQVLILDPLYLTIGGKLVDEADVRKILGDMNRLIADTHITLVIIHHARQDTIIDGTIYQSLDDIFGSSMIPNWADTIIRTTQPDKNKDEVILSFDKVRHAEEKLKPIRVAIRRSDLTFRLVQ